MIETSFMKNLLEKETPTYKKGFEAGQKAALQWQPIETAPKDGTLILAYKKKKREGKKLTWRNPPIVLHWDSEEEIWLEAENSNWERRKMTHWMPLLPPVTEVGNE